MGRTKWLLVVGVAALLGAGPRVAEAGSITAVGTTSFLTATDLDPHFSLDFNGAIPDSTTRPWVAVDAEGAPSGLPHFYQFTVDHVGAVGTIQFHDIELPIVGEGLPELFFYLTAGRGTLLANSVFKRSAGEVIHHTFETTGVHYIVLAIGIGDPGAIGMPGVGRPDFALNPATNILEFRTGDIGPQPTETYRLRVSLDAAPVPTPTAALPALAGIAALFLRRRGV